MSEQTQSNGSRRINAMRAKAGAAPPVHVEEAKPKRGRQPSTSGTAAARFRELILAGTMSDAEIHATVEREFDKKIPTSAVGHYRKYLAKRGHELGAPEAELPRRKPGRKPKAVIEETPAPAPARRNASRQPREPMPQPATTKFVKRSAAETKLEARLNTLIAQHGHKAVNKLLDGLDGLVTR